MNPIHLRVFSAVLAGPGGLEWVPHDVGADLHGLEYVLQHLVAHGRVGVELDEEGLGEGRAEVGGLLEVAQGVGVAAGLAVEET